MKDDPPDLNWTPEAQEWEQLRRWRLLPFRHKLRAVEEMGSMAESVLERRRLQGLPCIDSVTGQIANPRGV